MSNAVGNSEALEALKNFNTAVTTLRLYPSTASQVTHALQKAYRSIALYLKNHGALNFSNVDGPSLCGVPISHKTLGKIEGYELFQLLDLLQLKHLVLQPGLEKDTFHQLLIAITTSPQRINKEGGIRSFLHSLDLTEIFPEEFAVEAELAEQDPFAHFLVQSHFDVTKGKQYLSYLSGGAEDAVIASEVKDLVLDSTGTARLVTALTAILFKAPRAEEDFVTSLLFSKIMKSMDTLLSPDRIPAAVGETVRLYLLSFEGSALSIILLQEYPKGFGKALIHALLTKMDLRSFGQVITRIRQQEEKCKVLLGKTSKQCCDLRAKCNSLLDTAKGKLFLGYEKTKAQLESGEVERRAKRIQAGLHAILQGNISSLENDEIVKHFPASIDQLMANGKDDIAAALIERLAKELIQDQGKNNNRLVACLGTIGQHLVRKKRWNWLEKLAIPLLAWLKIVDRADSACEKILHVLHKIMLHSWKAGRGERGDQILIVFYTIRTGGLKKSAEMRALVDKVQEQAVDRNLLQVFLKQVLADVTDDVSRARLHRQGTFAAKFMISVLLESEKNSDRMILFELLTDMREVLPPLLVERLEEPMPWYGKRNLIKLLADTGNEHHVETVMRYMSHEDLRVQQEAFICLYKISGARRNQVLLDVLSVAGEQMKVQTVKALLPFTGDDVAQEMLGILEMRDNFSSGIRSSLVKHVCRYLGQCSPLMALEPLIEFKKTKGKGSGKKLGNNVWAVVEDSLAQLRSKQRANKAAEKQDDIQNSVEANIAITTFPEEKEARYLFEKGKTEQALEIITKLIEKSARLKHFDQAERLREWLIEEEPGALTEIIKAADIIEEEKYHAIDKGHLSVWSKLYDVLTTEEFNAFYHALEQKVYDAGDPIVRQGDTRCCLCFINSGRIKLFYQEHEHDILIHTMGAGEVLGVGSFFDASVWTNNVSSINKVQVSTLRLSKMVKWERDFPALEAKLRDFCEQFETVPESLKVSGKNRRKEPRKQFSGNVLATFLDRGGKAKQITIRGEATDISLGGISFCFRISQKANAHLLLGRTVRVVIPLALRKERGLTREGVVLAVKSLRSINNDYSLHVKFSQDLDRSALQDLLTAAPDA